MNASPDTVVLTEYFLPGHAGGGPIRSVANLVRALPNMNFLVLSRDHDLGSPEPYPTEIRPKLPNAAVVYLSTRSMSARLGFIRSLMSLRPQVLYLNSMFSPWFAVLPMVLISLRLLRARRVVVAPRGELGSGALNLKGRKKRAYLTFFRAVLRRHVDVFHATSEQERIAIESNFPGARVAVLGNVPSSCSAGMSAEQTSPPTSSGRSGIVFVGRISPKKNIISVIRALGIANRDGKSANLLIVGPVDDPGYYRECLTAVEQEGLERMISWAGALPHPQVRAVLESSAIFAHPSFDENFGHSILEALQSGLPVIVGPTVPWAREIENGAGWVVDPYRVEAIATAIKEGLAASKSEWEALSARCREIADSYAAAFDAEPYVALLMGKD